MNRHEIKCIHKGNSQNPFDIIQSVGGINSNGTRWKISKNVAIEGIESGKWQFFITIDSNIIEVVIAQYLGTKYLKTNLDNEFPETILSLPECP
jgi:hypothetical protein